MRALTLTAVLLVALGAASLTFGPPVRAHCPVDGVALEVRIPKSRVYRPIAFGGPTAEPFYTCPHCRFSGTAADFTAPPWSAEDRARALVWLSTPGAVAKSPSTRAAALATALSRPPMELARRYALAAVLEPRPNDAVALWRRAEAALADVGGTDARASQAAIRLLTGDSAGAERLLRVLDAQDPAAAQRVRRGVPRPVGPPYPKD